MVLPAGVFKVRSNDTDYPFRPDTAFAYYGGLGTDEEPDSVLVVEPSADDPQRGEATYFFRPRAGFDTTEFYADARYGELWVGRRPTLEETEQRLGISCRHIDTLRDHLAKDVGDQLSLVVMPGVDQGVEEMVRGIGPAGRRISLMPVEVVTAPVMLTEFGGVSYVTGEVPDDSWGYSSAGDAEDFEARLRAILEPVHASPALSGFCYTQLTDTHQETNGLCDAARRPKLGVATLAAIVRGES